MSQMPEQSFLLLKPDAIRLDRVQAITDEVAKSRLTVICTRDIVLTPAHVRSLWSEYSPDIHPLTFAFLDRYLCAGVSRVLCVAGLDAFEASRRIKRAIRSRFSGGVFANVVHAAETRAELARQKAILMERCPNCAVIAHEGDRDSVLRPSGLHIDEVEAGLDAIGEVWNELERSDGRLEEPVPVQLGGDGGPLWGVLFGVDSYNSVDSAVAAVKWSLPGLDLVSALRMAIYAGRADGHLIATGDETSARACFASLKSFGIRNCNVTKLDAKMRDASV
jgi:nucleoside diphosphate kinase